MTVWLMRHPRVQLPRPLCYGRSEVPLDEAHVRQCAEALAQSLPPRTRIVTSERERTRCVARQLGALRPDLRDWQVDARLNEMDFGQWEMVAWADIPQAAVDAWCFVQAALDGYCGWLHSASLGRDLPPVTHHVTAPATHLYPAPDMKQRETASLSIGARLSVAGIEGRFVRLATGSFVPIQHVGNAPASDPVPVAESLLGTPYMWGGNSRWGIDCSGLVQAALTACDIPCPGDSDLQRGAFPAVDDIRRGDLLFWPGHVALAMGPDRMIHATAFAMAVIVEPIPDALARIEAAGDGPFLGIRRPALAQPAALA